MYDINASERSGVEVRVRLILRAVGNSVDKFVCCCCFFLFFFAKKKTKKKRQKSEPAKGDSDHAIQIRCGWRASMNPCSSIPSPEGDSQPLEELTRRLWGRDPKALAYEVAYAGDGVHSGKYLELRRTLRYGDIRKIGRSDN